MRAIRPDRVLRWRSRRALFKMVPGYPATDISTIIRRRVCSTSWRATTSKMWLGGGTISDGRDRTFSRSPLSSEEIRFRPREVSRPSSSATMSSPTSAFTIENILAPRPIGNMTPTSTSSLGSIIQNPEAVGSPSRTTPIHPLQQQIHHLAFTSADLFGELFRVLDILFNEKSVGSVERNGKNFFGNWILLYFG